MDVDIQEIAEVFFLKGYEWDFDGEQRIPDAKDIQEALDRAKSALYTEPVPSTWHAGRLIVHHWKQDHFDVYLQMGTY